jgi:hypothetical protein
MSCPSLEVQALAGDVMAGTGSAAAPAHHNRLPNRRQRVAMQDVQYKPAGNVQSQEKIHIVVLYHVQRIISINACGAVV